MSHTLSLDRTWHFHPGDLQRTNRYGGMDDYRPRVHWTKTGRHEPSLPGYDVRAWRTVDIPHDWAIEGVPDPTTDVNHGSRVGNVAWYRREFHLPAEAAGQWIRLEFDGIYRDCEVWVNGAFAGSQRSGYLGFQVDISDICRPGAANAVAVRVDASEFEGWWYEGAGIYRSARLRMGSVLHLAPDGVQCITRLYDRCADVLLHIEVENTSASDEKVQVTAELVDPVGECVGSASGGAPVAADNEARISLSMQVAEPHLWTPDDPALYVLRIVLSQDGVACDESVTYVGLRTIAVDAQQGMLLNGERLKLRGVSCHQDFAGVGVALPDALHAHRIALLKRMGANAYRSAHHAPAPALLDACDRLGLLVMDEARHFATSEEAVSQLERLVRRDRHHPCVVMWSLGNEEMELQGAETGARVARRLRRLVHALDGSRPVTLAMNGDWMGPLAADPDCVDIVGFNYSPAAYDEFHRQRPGRPMVGSETGATLATRGVYLGAKVAGHLTWDQHVNGCRPRHATDQDPGHCHADGDTCASFGDTPWDAWRAIADRDFVMGTFVWTGFDYRGEPCPRQQWPCITTNFGLTDLCGFPKDIWWYYRAWWQTLPVLHILPHWDWPGRAGEAIGVRCFSNARHVELLLNGQSFGTRAMEKHGHVQWSVPYAAGRLEAIGTWADGTRRHEVIETTGSAARLAVHREQPGVGHDGRFIVLLRISIEDAAGRALPAASSQVHVGIEGPGKILGVHNGDTSFLDAEQSDRIRLFNGLALVVIEMLGGSDGVSVSLQAPGFPPLCSRIVDIQEMFVRLPYVLNAMNDGGGGILSKG